LQEQGIVANGAMVRLVEPYVDVKEGQRRDTSVEREGYRQMLSMSERPTAVVAANNYHARTLIDVAEELDLHVPKDISIVGMGGSQTAESIRPTLTFARQNFELMGQEAFLALQRLIEQPGEMRHSVIPAVVETGRSVCAIDDQGR
jgi:LacI family transcriptional regulator